MPGRRGYERIRRRGDRAGGPAAGERGENRAAVHRVAVRRGRRCLCGQPYHVARGRETRTGDHGNPHRARVAVEEVHLDRILSAVLPICLVDGEVRLRAALREVRRDVDLNTGLLR